MKRARGIGSAVGLGCRRMPGESCGAQAADAGALTARPEPHSERPRRGVSMIVCLRTVEVPAPERRRYLDWIAEGRRVRQDHGILAELVLEPASGEGETVVITIWPSHEIFDAWIATPDRDRLTASGVHAAVDYRPITRYAVVGGYLNLAGLRA